MLPDVATLPPPRRPVQASGGGAVRCCKGAGGGAAGTQSTGQGLVDHLAQLALADGANLGGLNLAILEQQQHRDRAHVVLHRGGAAFVHIDLGNLQLAVIGLCQFIQHRGNHLARAAPFGPEIHQYRLARLQDRTVKVGVADV